MGGRKSSSSRSGKEFLLSSSSSSSSTSSSSSLPLLTCWKAFLIVVTIKKIQSSEMPWSLLLLLLPNSLFLFPLYLKFHPLVANCTPPLSPSCFTLFPLSNPPMPPLTPLVILTSSSLLQLLCLLLLLLLRLFLCTSIRERRAVPASTKAAEK